MDDKEKWEAIVKLSEGPSCPSWGYEETRSGKKFLAKKFEFRGNEIHDFTIYRLERMLNELWEGEQESPDIFVLSNILEAYVSEEVLIEWVDGFPMAHPNLDAFDDYLFDDLP